MDHDSVAAATRSFMVAALVAFASPASALDLSPDDIDALGRIAFAEAAGEPDAGKAAVIAVVLNRAAVSGSVQDTIDAPGQFEPVSRAPGRTWRGLPELSLAQRTKFIEVLLGHMQDVTGGATHFQNPAIVAQRARNGTVRPSRVDFGGMPKTAVIGNHVFYADGGRRARGGSGAAVSVETRFVTVQDYNSEETVFLNPSKARAPEKDGEMRWR